MRVMMRIMMRTWRMTGPLIVTLVLVACGHGEVGINAAASGGAGGVGGAGGASASGGDMTPPAGDPCDEEGATSPCYGGELSLANVGACTLGERRCEVDGEFLVWGECSGYGQPSSEQCGDDIDSDCDGKLDNDCPMLACDGVSFVWTDPDMDGSLRLTGKQTAGFGAADNHHSSICSLDETRITVCQNTTLLLTGDKPTVIAGVGIGPKDEKIVTLQIVTDSNRPIWIEPDTTHGPIQFDFLAPNAAITFVHRMPGTFGICGVPGDVAVYHAGNSSVSIGPLPGANCVNNQPGYGLEAKGGAFFTGDEALPSPPTSCP
jgi:hypothetical protein